MFLVPGSFSSKVNSKCDAKCYNDMITYDIGQFVDWAKSDSRVWGVVPWTWGSCTTCTGSKDEIGTVALPKLQSAWTVAFDELG